MSRDGPYETVPTVAADGGLTTQEEPRHSPRWRRAALLVSAVGCAGAVAAAAARVRGAQRAGLAVASKTGIEHTFRLYEPGEGDLLMPEKSSQYDGVEDPRSVTVETDEWGQVHVFAIGDWGAPVADHVTAASEFGVDDRAQFAVADAMKNRGSWAKPQYVLNVGDNFYLGGISMDCNLPPKEAWGKPKDDFTSTWTAIYGEMANIPWLSVLGNHDYGGWMFNQGWPQQIGYSFVNHNWVMPARYYNKKIQHPGYEVEYFMLDTNAFDAKVQGDEPEHNICSMTHNMAGAGCADNDGMANIWSCRDWFWGSWKQQKIWFEEKLAESTAQWKIVVTHFPCGYDGSWFKALRAKYGLDLVATGHRHQQELWWPGTTSSYVRDFMSENDLGDLPCFVSGGGGGITAQKFDYADYGRDLIWYGFFHLTIAKDYMRIELIGLDGAIAGNYTIHPSSPGGMNLKKPAPY